MWFVYNMELVENRESNSSLIGAAKLRFTLFACDKVWREGVEYANDYVPLEGKIPRKGEQRW